MPLLGRLPGWPAPVPNMSIENAGALTASTQGTTVISGSNNWGNWTELLASTAKRVVAIIVCYDGLGVNCRGEMAIGKGSAGSEVYIAKWQGYCYSLGSEPCRYTGIIPCDIPAGTRIAARVFGWDSNTQFRIMAYLIEVDD